MAHLNNQRSKLLLGSGSAALAIGLLLMPSMASAQAIQATDSVQSGVVERIITGSTTETIEVSSDTAVIDWTPLEDGQGNALDFLPTGHEVTFENGSVVTDFAVLNRILPSTNGDIAVFDGTVISRLNGTPGGTVAFYSPTGILVGSNALFDVGNLILTTLDVNLASFDDFAINGASLALGGQPTTARIEISPGAQILATAENSFFAVTAAEIQMFGTSNVNGSQAYVAGETVNITVSNGLFDIQIPVGTTAAEPIVFNGNVGGPSSTGVGDNHLIYAVAAAQNDPISLLFSGNLGFAPAAGAGIVNGEIILSANYDVFGRNVAGRSIDGSLFENFSGLPPLNATPADILITDINSTSTLAAVASGLVDMVNFSSSSFIDGNLLLHGAAASLLNGGGLFDITGDLLVSSNVVGFDTGLVTAGDATFINTGLMTIGGNVRIDASAIAGYDSMTNTGGSAIAGLASLENSGDLSIFGDVNIEAIGFSSVGSSSAISLGDVTGGVAQIVAFPGDEGPGGSILNIAGNVNIFGSALGIEALSLGSTAANAFAGEASVQVFGDAQVAIVGDLSLRARGDGGDSNFTGVGTIGQGGSVFVLVDGLGSISAQSLSMDAFGQGGANQAGTGGDGFGGTVAVSVQAGGVIDTGFSSLRAVGFGGDGIDGGNGFGGSAGLEVVTGTAQITFADVEASGFGGNASFDFGGNGGDGFGGHAFLQATGTLTDTALLTIANGGVVNSSGTGGIGGAGDGGSIGPGRGGDGFGGEGSTSNQANDEFTNGAYVLGGSDNGVVNIGGVLTVFSDGIGGFALDGGLGQIGGDGGNGSGGTVRVGQALFDGDGSVGAGTASFETLLLRARGIGSNGGLGASAGLASGNGGIGSGGFDVLLTAQFGAVSVDDLTIFADAFGGIGQIGGDAFGGRAAIVADNGGSVAIGGGALLNSTAAGNGSGEAGSIGGNATGGEAILQSLNGGSISIVGLAQLTTTAFGGISNFDGPGAFGRAGNSSVTVDGAGTISLQSLDFSASGFGGENESGIGGIGFGGLAEMFVRGGGSLFVVTDILGDVRGSGGNGEDGGDGFGGSSGVDVSSGTVDIGGNVIVTAEGVGGNAAFGFGGNGGTGNGGLTFIRATGTLTETADLTITGAAQLFSTGIGGAGGVGDGGTIEAGRGGDGLAGQNGTLNQAATSVGNGAYVLGDSDNGFLSIGGGTSVVVEGVGGLGGAGGAGQVGGDGGNGVGGSALVGTSLLSGDGSVGAGVVTFGDVDINSAGNGGNGGLGGGSGIASGNGGDGTGFEAFFTSSFSTVNAGDVIVWADGNGGSGEIGGIGTGGLAFVLADNSSLVISDTLSLSAGANGGFGNAVGGDAVAGQVGIQFDASLLQIGNELLFQANANAGGATNGIGGNAIGGVASTQLIDDDSSLIIGSNWGIEARAIGGDGSSTAQGGSALGGTVNIQIDAATGISVGNNLTADVSAFGGGNAGSGPGGDGAAGAIGVLVNGGGTLEAFGVVQLFADGRGGFGFGGGNGQGGLVSFEALNGTVDIFSDFNASADGLGGDAVRGDGGIGRGGTAVLRVLGNANGAAVVTIQGSANLSADGAGGAGGAGDGGSIAAGNGGDAFGGRNDFSSSEPTFGGAIIEVGAENGSLTIVGVTDVTADGDGGFGGDGGIGQAGGDGGNASGGEASVSIIPLGIDSGVSNGIASFGDLIIEALAIGGNGGNGGGTTDPRGNGGDANAFRASLSVGFGSLTATNVDISADAEGGDGFNGGIATGGELASMTNRSGGSIAIDSVLIAANGIGGNSFGGVAGAGQGGEALLAFDGGDTLVNTNATVQADGSGGAGNEGDGAVGTGGIATIANNNGSAPSTLTVNGDATVFANGFGGNGASGFTGGAGTGGDGTVRAQVGSVVNLGSLLISGGGQGGSGTGAVGGDGLGGTAGFVSTGSGTQIIIQNENQFGQPVQANAALLAANGVGGETSGGNGLGGTGTGGAILLSAIDGGAITLAPGVNSGNRLLARGIGGRTSVDGGTGGAAIGGTGTVLADNGTIDAGRMLFSTAAIGGNSADFNLNISGGDSSGSERDIEVRNNGELTVELFGGTSGGSGGFGSGTGIGANSSGGQTRLTVDNGTVNFVGNSILFTQNFGGQGTLGGSAFGGTTDVVINGGTINILANANGDARLEIGATSIGGSGTDQSGDAQAGDINATITNSTITGGDLFVNATAFSNEAANQGGNAVGGNIVFTLSDTVINAGTMNINANAFGGDGGDGTVLTGNGGNAEGGQVVVDATGSTINLLGSLRVQAQGFGANGLVGGNALGGAAQLNLAQTNILVGLDANQISEVLIDASATGGQSDNQNGDATGGTAGLQMLDSTIDALGLTIVSDGVGLVNQGNALADGGQATAGLVDAVIEGASSITVDTFALFARAYTVESGFANGGQVNFLMSGGSGDPDVTAQLMDINVSATGAVGSTTPANTVGVFDVQVLSGQINLANLNGLALGDFVDGQNGPSSLTAIGGDILTSSGISIDVLSDLNITTGQGSIIGGPTIASPTAQILISTLR